MRLSSTAIAIGTLVLTALLYAGSCAVWPYARCTWCKGTGRWAREDGHVFRPCWWCRGSARRLRLGRRVWNRARRAHRDAS